MVVLKKPGRTGLVAGFFSILLLVTSPSGASDLPLWELEGTEGRVQLMGSVHFLRSSDYPLPDALEAAYASADTIVMEIDMDDLDPMTAQSIMTGLAVSSDGSSLQDSMGAEYYAEASRLAAELGIPLQLFDQFKPWFAALSITQMRMVQLGFDPAWGIEAQITQRAANDGKSISGLETLEEQLGFMDDLDLESQSLFLLQTLEDAGAVQEEVKTIVEAWRSGDTATLEELLLQGLQASPRLFDALLDQRNRNWVPQIVRLSEQPGNHLVIVGAMHLVGNNSIQRLLEGEGIATRQLQSLEQAGTAQR